MTADSKPAAPPEWTGTLHLLVAFDWGEEIDLEQARRLAPAETVILPRRRRTPASFGYRPPPVRLRTPAPKLEAPGLGPLAPETDVTLFDFAAVSIALRAPFRLSGDGLLALADWLADPAPVVKAARAALAPLYEQLRGSIENPAWADDLSEEYFVFQFDSPAPPPADVLKEPWLPGLLLLESGPLSEQEAAEAMRLRISYAPRDLLVPNWAAAALFDRDCDETLQAIEFANLQLLELRHIDGRLDDSLAEAYRLVEAKNQPRFWRRYARPLRKVGELKVEANSLFERTENVLKLVGDQYLARAYRLLSDRFHLSEWEENIQRKLEVVEGVYQVASAQAETYRMEFLEVIVIVLIALEIVLALVRH